MHTCQSKFLSELEEKSKSGEAWATVLLFRYRHGLTMSKSAELAGVSPQTWRNIEKRSYKPSKRIMDKINEMMHRYECRINPKYINLRQKMRWYRTEHKLTMKDCANRAGLSVDTWWRIETGVSNPKKETEAKLCDLVGHVKSSTAVRDLLDKAGITCNEQEYRDRVKSIFIEADKIRSELRDKCPDAESAKRVNYSLNHIDCYDISYISSQEERREAIMKHFYGISTEDEDKSDDTDTTVTDDSMYGRITCKSCGKDFPMMGRYHYVCRDDRMTTGMFAALATGKESRTYDAFDCPLCGCQNIIGDRKRAEETYNDDERDEDGECGHCQCGDCMECKCDPSTYQTQDCGGDE